ncbi:LysM peptidoglycan-binding domain-containing protein [Ammonicoccus fulvus]|uniref:LysM peptidoglycan-binding domain-containing protein n=1 Tax=Ammonicoccus fulvus TaxID=3138240 RepID=A0ABZ3FVM6_9ACTN
MPFRILRGLAALIVTLALVVGTPWLLVLIGRRPDLTPFPEVLFRPDQGQLLLGFMTLAGWLAWAAFTVSIVAELIALLSGQRLRVHLPGLGAPRSLAAGLLVAIAAMVPMSAAHAEPAPPAAAAPVEAKGLGEIRAAVDSGEDQQAWLRYTVERGDDLWSIAERFYGDGLAWSRIVAANPQVTSPDQIDVGWVLVLPDIPDPNVAREPDLPPTPEPSAPEARPDPAVAPASPGPARAPAPTASTSAAERPVESVEHVGAGNATPADRIAYATAGISSLTAAALLGLLAARRLTQLANRPQGRRILHPSAPAQHFENALDQAQDPLTLRTLDLALRALARHYRDAGEALPRLGAVLVADDRITLEVDRIPARLPVGFHADSRHLWVGIPDADEMAEEWEALADEPAPYPTLVGFGETEAGELLLQDLESLGALGMEGTPELVTQALNAFVIELCSSPWNSGQSVLVVDGDAELAEALGSPLIEIRDSVEDVLVELEAETQPRRAIGGEEHPRDLRIRPEFTEAWSPRVLVIGSALTDGQRRRLLRLTWDSHLVVIAADEELPTLRVQASPELSDLPNARTFHAQLLAAETRKHLLEVLTVTDSTETTPAPWWAETNGATVHSLAARRAAGVTEEPAVDSHEPVLHPEQPEILLVGPVELVGARGERPARAVRQCVEYAAWLLENPRATATSMGSALLVAEGTRRSNMSRLRSWLGADEEGDRYLPEAYSGRIALHPDVTSDWQRMQLLTVGGINRSSDANLIQVLDLVRGAPLADAAPGQWGWAEELRTDISSFVRDVALVVAERALARGEVDLARWAVNRALNAAPEDEQLLVARVRAEHLAGNRSEVERLSLRLARSARQLNIDLAADTVTLLQEVLEGSPRARGLG